MKNNWTFNLNKQIHNHSEDLPDPLGYAKGSTVDIIEGEKRQAEMKTLIENKLWQFSTGGASQILMAVIMMWISGSSLNIFTIIMTFSIIMQPAKNLFNVNNAFKQFEGKKISLLQYKLIYMGINSFVFSLGLYKLYIIGLLPFSPSDWIDLIPRQTQHELAVDIQI